MSKFFLIWAFFCSFVLVLLLFLPHSSVSVDLIIWSDDVWLGLVCSALYWSGRWWSCSIARNRCSGCGWWCMCCVRGFCELIKLEGISKWSYFFQISFSYRIWRNSRWTKVVLMRRRRRRRSNRFPIRLFSNFNRDDEDMFSNFSFSFAHRFLKMLQESVITVFCLRNEFEFVPDKVFLYFL